MPEIIKKAGDVAVKEISWQQAVEFWTYPQGQAELKLQADWMVHYGRLHRDSVLRDGYHANQIIFVNKQLVQKPLFGQALDEERSSNAR